MAQPYFSLVTTVGKIKLAASAAGGAAVTITHFAIGDGNGTETNPTAASTALVREVWRTGVESVITDPLNPAAVVVTALIPTQVGGWWMREFGVFDTAGDMIAVAKPVSQYKPTALEGQLEDIRYEFQIIIGETANVTLLVDPSVLLASRAWVEGRKTPLNRIQVTPWVPVRSMTVTAPPGNAAIGDTYLIPAAATGIWAGHGGKLAEWTSGGWALMTTPDGHGIGLPDGRVFTRRGAAYVELAATSTFKGLVELATAAETQAGSDATRAVTPEGLASRTATETRTGLVELATIAEANAGADDTRAVTSAGVWSAKRQGDIATAGGTANALTLTLSPAPTEYSRGMVVDVKISVTNTGPATLDINGLGPVNIRASEAGPLLVGGELVAGERVRMVYNGAIFSAQNAQATTGNSGLVELATDAETQEGTDSKRAVTSAGLTSRTATETRTGLVELATIAEANAGGDTTRAVTSAGVWSAKRQGDIATAGGTANALTLALSPAPTEYTIGMTVDVKISTTNTGPATIDINGLGARNIRATENGQLLTGGELAAGERVRMVFNGAIFVAQNGQATNNNTGLVELATQAETQAGDSDKLVVTTAGLASRTATPTRTGLVELATIAEAVAGLGDFLAVTPPGLKAAIDATEQTAAGRVLQIDVTERNSDQPTSAQDVTVITRTITPKRGSNGRFYLAAIEHGSRDPGGQQTGSLIRLKRAIGGGAAETLSVKRLNLFTATSGQDLVATSVIFAYDPTNAGAQPVNVSITHSPIGAGEVSTVYAGSTLAIMEIGY